MAFVLLSITRGDDLIPPKTTPVAVSPFAAVLEMLRLEREAERAEYLRTHALPYFRQESVIDREEIVEVPFV